MKYILCLGALLASTALWGQQSNLGNWLIYIGNKKIVDRWSWHHEVQYRNYNAIGDLEQLLLRTGVGYNLDDKGATNVLLGYAFVHSQPYLPNSSEKTFTNEHRIFQQLILKQSFGRLALQHRYRFEQRWVDQVFSLRFRYFLSAQLALSRPQMGPKTLYLSSYNEIFIRATDAPYDRNRLYGGVGYQINKAFKVELGYMNQFLPQGNRDQINLFLFLNF